MDEQWDYLIILDACRYDYFERVWKKYFDSGQLSRRKTVGTVTLQWRDNSFKEYYDDVVYVSANPYINSAKAVKGFLGTDHFRKVYDVWKSGWDEGLGTVRPETVTAAAIEAAQSHPKERVIVHYLQPHAPYLSLGQDSRGFPVPDLDSASVMTGTTQQDDGSRRKRNILKKLVPILRKFPVLGNCPDWILAGWLNMSPRSPMDAVRRKYGNKGLRRAYAANLEKVLEQVVILTGHLSGRVVVTSDHGEQLGERLCYTHVPGSDNPHLLDIPWLVLEQPKRSVENVPADTARMPAESPGAVAGDDGSGDKEDQEIEERLRSLGYFD